MAAGAIPVDISGDLSSQSSATSTGGSIKNGAIFNSSGGGIGLVKMLALAGIGFLIWRMLKR